MSTGYPYGRFRNSERWGRACLPGCHGACPSRGFRLYWERLRALVPHVWMLIYPRVRCGTSELLRRWYSLMECLTLERFIWGSGDGSGKGDITAFRQVIIFDGCYPAWPRQRWLYRCLSADSR